MQKLRVLSISNCPLQEHLGSGYVALNYAKGLQGEGHFVESWQPQQFESFRCISPYAQRYRQAFGMAVRLMRRGTQLKDYDLIEFWGGEAWLAMRYLSRRRRPMLVQHTNGPEPRYDCMLDCYFGPKRRKWFQFNQAKLMKAAFTCANLVVTVSESDREWLIDQQYVPATRVVAIENPIAEVFHSSSSVDRKERLIGYCGTWLPKKGVHVMAADVSRILAEFKTYRLLLIGVGVTFRKQDYFPKAVCDRIEVVPFVGDKELLVKLYDRIAIFAFPSVVESFGLALAEAMSRGCAVVTTRVGFGASLHNNREALVMSSSASPELYSAIKQLIGDSELRRRLGEAARRRVQHLRWSEAIQKLLEAYRGVLSFVNPSA